MEPGKRVDLIVLATKEIFTRGIWRDQDSIPG